MTIALSVEGITYILVIYKTDWSKQAKLVSDTYFVQFILDDREVQGHLRLRLRLEL
jgi:hypothetical protein